jgi:hypothetical protein
MTDFYTQVTLEHDSALPEDRSINTFAADISAVDEAGGLAAWHSALNTFYQGVDGFLSSALSGLGTIKSYRRTDPKPRVPILTTDITITPGTNVAPAEVALCVSFQAVRVAGLSQARRRGRIYLGPLHSTILDSSTGRPVTTSVASIVAAADALVTASKAATLWKWSVWSEVNQQGREVDNGWVDNAYDTQRRRGLRPTTRTLFS